MVKRISARDRWHLSSRLLRKVLMIRSPSYSTLNPATCLCNSLNWLPDKNLHIGCATLASVACLCAFHRKVALSGKTGSLHSMRR